MSQTAKTARDAMKAKAKRLASAEPGYKVDSSTWTPPEAEEGSVQTGMRPLSKRAFKKGGKVIGKADGKKAEFRADRKPRASGGKLEKYLKFSNADRRSRENENDEMNEMSSKAANSMPEREFFAMDRQIEENARKIKNREKGSNLASAKLKGMAKVPARKEGGRATRYLTPDNLINRDQKMANEARDGAKHVGGLKHGGKAHKLGGGAIGNNPIATQNQALSKAMGVQLKRGGKAKRPHHATDGYVPGTDSEGQEQIKRMIQNDDGFRMGAPGRGMPATGEPVYKKSAPAVDTTAHPGRKPKYADQMGAKKGGKIWEGSKKDESQDRMLAKKYGISMKEWEKSEMDKKHDKQQSMEGLKKGGRAEKMKGGSSGMLARYLPKAVNEIGWRGAETGKKAAKFSNDHSYANWKAVQNAEEKYAKRANGAQMAMSKLGMETLSRPAKVMATEEHKHGGKAMHHEDCSCKMCSGGRTMKNKGGSVFKGEGYPFKVPGEVKGGRSAHAAGGKAGKGKMNVNIIIGAHGQPQGGIMPNAPVPAPLSPRTPPAGAMGAGAPPMPAGANGGMPPMPPQGMPMGRKSGGRTRYPIDSGAGGGEARLEKISAYGLKPAR